MEKIIKPMSGYLTLILTLVLLAVSIALFANSHGNGWMITGGVILSLSGIFLSAGLIVISPNHSRVLTFFGKYVGTAKENGLLFVNPLYTKQKISLRAENLESSRLKVNDSMGNPIEIAAVIVWRVADTYKAAFEVEDYEQYVKVQSEAAIRHLATSFPYDQFEDENASITLRGGGEKVNELLEKELSDRLAPAGIQIIEARISHLAYAQEIAGAMLQRQQATAIVAARTKIVEGAVGMVELALEQLSKKEIVHLDEEKKAAMVSNLMVVLCAEKAATPILNTGTLYQ
ncbi:SPFH domain-containing protein [Flavihumibacter cheonanensis]|uniref:SPFH domain-containing protein n=1 Tax=Flavihumibacter cheonanensis TaxID=1442385 RepID=UPI001EF758FD|nr:SPFH domain-containing protein [Flavihumibacter cheonanensis]MCG7751889.1 SPFH domain-containing protein [Flavihumibacter cheonanensis]